MVWTVTLIELDIVCSMGNSAWPWSQRYAKIINHPPTRNNVQITDLYRIWLVYLSGTVWWKWHDNWIKNQIKFHSFAQPSSNSRQLPHACHVMLDYKSVPLLNAQKPFSWQTSVINGRYSDTCSVIHSPSSGLLKDDTNYCLFLLEQKVVIDWHDTYLWQITLKQPSKTLFFTMTFYPQILVSM
jgi:hypothetical protein